ncbi:MAG: hypothetical protein RR051_05395 [Clostridiales bacterium]
MIAKALSSSVDIGDGVTVKVNASADIAFGTAYGTAYGHVGNDAYRQLIGGSRNPYFKNIQD